MNLHQDQLVMGPPGNSYRRLCKRVVIAVAPLILTMSAAAVALSPAHNLTPSSPVPPVLACRGDTPGLCPDGIVGT